MSNLKDVERLLIPIGQIDEYNMRCRTIAKNLGCTEYYRYTVEGQFVLTPILDNESEKGYHSIVQGNDNIS